jgi:hypothetical protein
MILINIKLLGDNNLWGNTPPFVVFINKRSNQSKIMYYGNCNSKKYFFTKNNSSVVKETKRIAQI